MGASVIASALLWPVAYIGKGPSATSGSRRVLRRGARQSVCWSGACAVAGAEWKDGVWGGCIASMASY